MAKVLKLTGAEINYHNPPPATRKVQWSRPTIGGRTVLGSFRSVACLTRLDNLAQNKFNSKLQVIQSAYNTTVAASAGTHDYDAVYDVYIPGVDWWRAQRFLRANGFPCWVRTPAQGFPWHIHGMVLPADGWDFRTRVGIFVPGQLSDYHNRRDGLASHSADNTWHPANIKATAFELGQFILNQRAAA